MRYVCHVSLVKESNQALYSCTAWHNDQVQTLVSSSFSVSAFLGLSRANIHSSEKSLIQPSSLEFAFYSRASCVLLSSMSVSTSLWMEMVRRKRMTWGGRSMWWRRWLRSCLAWSPSAVPSSEKSKTLFLWSFLMGRTVLTLCVAHNCAVCRQAATSGHRAKSEAVEASAEPAGDLQPPPRERPELLSGGAMRCFVFATCLCRLLMPWYRFKLISLPPQCHENAHYYLLFHDVSVSLLNNDSYL